MCQAIIFDAALIGEQDPEGVDAEGSAERRMQQRDDAEHDSRCSCPWLDLHQSPANKDATCGDDKERPADDR